jgi:uncharacterized iron-regulated protein
MSCTLAGCASQRRPDLAARTGGNAFLFKEFEAFDGRTGRQLLFADVVRRCRSADVILFGEQHGDRVCNQLEAQLLYALIGNDRPVALAMEFFAADTQASLDAYLCHRVDEPGFLKLTKRPDSYLNTHRPLIELSRAFHVPVVAANAPRGLVRDYRKSGLSYAEYRAQLDPGDQRWLPTSSDDLGGPYRTRFAEMMKGHGGVGRPASQPTTGPASQPAREQAVHATSQPTSAAATQPVTQPAADTQSALSAATPPAASMPAAMPAASPWQDFYKAQLLWDDAMAESIAGFRACRPRHRVLLVVGSFHVAHDGGTAIKLRQRRPDDDVITIVYRGVPDGQFALQTEDRGAGEIVVYGLTPPEPEERTMPSPGRKPRPAAPESQPATQPAESQPADITEPEPPAA